MYTMRNRHCDADCLKPFLSLPKHCLVVLGRLGTFGMGRLGKVNSQMSSVQIIASARSCDLGSADGISLYAGREP